MLSVLSVQGPALPALLNHLNVSEFLLMGSLGVKGHWNGSGVSRSQTARTRGWARGQVRLGVITLPCCPRCLSQTGTQRAQTEPTNVTPHSLSSCSFSMDQAAVTTLRQPGTHSVQQGSLPHEKPPRPAMWERKPFHTSPTPIPGLPFPKRQPTLSWSCNSRGLLFSAAIIHLLQPEGKETSGNIKLPNPKHGNSGNRHSEESWEDSWMPLLTSLDLILPFSYLA